MHKQGLALNNLECLIYHKTQPNQTKPNQKRIREEKNRTRNTADKLRQSALLGKSVVKI